MTMNQINIVKEVGVIEFLEKEIVSLSERMELLKGFEVDESVKNDLASEYKRQISDFEMKKDIMVESLKAFYDYDYKVGVANA